MASLFKTTSELRRFGITIGLAFGLLAAFFWWRDRSFWPVLAWTGVAFLLLGLIWPRLLGPVEWIWMKVAHVIGAVVTRVLLTLTFFLLVTPMGLVMRLVGHDPLEIRSLPERDSHWHPVPSDGPCSRPDKPY